MTPNRHYRFDQNRPGKKAQQSRTRPTNAMPKFRGRARSGSVGFDRVFMVLGLGLGLGLVVFPFGGRGSEFDAIRCDSDMFRVIPKVF